MGKKKKKSFVSLVCENVLRKWVFFTFIQHKQNFCQTTEEWLHFFFHFSYKYNSIIKQIVITSGSEYFLCFFSVSILFSTFPVLLGYFLFKFESSSGYQSYLHLISVSVHDKFSLFFSHPNASVTSVRSGRTLAIMAIILLILLRRRCIQITQWLQWSVLHDSLKVSEC